jgi:hypothetical protein
LAPPLAIPRSFMSNRRNAGETGRLAGLMPAGRVAALDVDFFLIVLAATSLILDFREQ